MSTKEQIIELLNNAQISSDKKSELLTNAFELLFYRDPSLLNEFYKNFIEFALERSAVTKKLIISYIEQICKKYPNYFAKSKNILLNLLKDQNKSIVKRTILCITNVIRSVLSYVLIQNNSEVWNSFNESKNLILQLHHQSDDESIKTNTFKFLEILVLTFTSSDDLSNKKTKTDEEFCLDKIPMDHPLIQRSQVQSEAETYLHLLLDSAKDLTNMTSTNIMILITSLSNIARLRLSLLSSIIPVICSSPNLVPKLSNIQNDSVKHSFKMNLISILRLKNQAVSPFVKQIIEGLALVDARDQGEESAKWYKGEPEKKKRQHSDQQSDQLLKKTKLDEQQQQQQQQQQFPPQQRINNGFQQELPALLMDRDTQLLLMQMVNSLPLDYLTNMVLENFQHVPLAQICQMIPMNHITEPLIQFIGSYQNLNQPPSIFSLQNQFNQQNLLMNNSFNNQQYQPSNNNYNMNRSSVFVPPPQIGLNKSISPPLKPTSTESPTQSSMAAFLPPPPPQNLGTTPFEPPKSNLHEEDEDEEDEDEMLVKKEEDEDEEIIDMAEEKVEMPVEPITTMNAPVLTQTIFERPTGSKPVFKISPLSKEQSSAMSASALNRIKSSEKSSASSGHSQLWASLFAKILSVIPSFTENPNTMSEILDFILGDFQNRREFALQWLQNELFTNTQIDNKSTNPSESDDDGDDNHSEENEKLISNSKYNHLLLQLFEKIKSTFKPTMNEQGRLISSFILDLPMITDRLLDELINLNNNSINYHINNINNDSIINLKENTSDEDIFSYQIDLVDELDDQWSTLSLRILRDIVIWRPTNKKRSLNSLLEFSISSNDKLRLPAVKLITHQLFLKSSIKNQIQIFARDQILQLLSIENITDHVKSEKERFSSTIKEEKKPEGEEMKTMEEDQPMTEDENMEKLSSEEKSEEDEKVTTTRNIQRFIERKLLLFFSLCTKNFQLISELLDIYPKCKDYLQGIIRGMVSSVTKSIGQSNELFLQELSVCPEGSQGLMIEILKSLVEFDKPSPELVKTVKQLISTQDDPRFLLPIVNGLEKEEIIEKLPIFISQAPEDAQSFVKMLASPGSPISPSELLVQLHLITESKELTNKSMKAIDYCFSMTNIFKQANIAISIQQLIALNPLPKLLMRTVLKSLSTFPNLKTFIVLMLHELVGKQIWNDESLWSGFILCAKAANPESLHVILQLPHSQFKLALQKDSESSKSSSSHDLKNYLLRYIKSKSTNISVYPKDNIKFLTDLKENK